MLRLAVYPMQLIQLGWRIVYLHYTLCNGWQLQVSSVSRLPFFRLARKVRISCYSCILNWMQLDYYAHICSDKKKDRCGMYPKKTLSAASLLSECERKRRRSLEARGCAKSESEFSMGTAATCPFIMSEQNPRNIKLHHQYMHKVTNKNYDKLKFPHDVVKIAKIW